MANTFTKIATVTVGSGGASTIDFNSIPATYTDLVIKMSARTTVSGDFDTFRMTINSSTGTYSNILVRAEDSVASSTSVTGQAQLRWLGSAEGDTATANTFGNFEIFFPNYASSNAKSMSADYVTEKNSSTGSYQGLGAGLWSGTAAITDISIYQAGYNFKQYSTATLYGISNS